MHEDGDPGSFGKALRRYRWVAGLTQEELARESGLSVRAVSDIERGHTSRPYARTIRLLADALKLDESARARLMSSVHDTDEQAAGERQEWVARSYEAAAGTAPMASDAAGTEAAPAARARGDERPWRDPRRGRWAQLAAASAAAAALAGGVAGWAIVDHVRMNPQAVSRPQRSEPPTPVSDGASRTVSQCDQGTVDLASSLVRGSDGAFLGTVEVRYSYRCASVWTLFDPSPVSDTKAVMVTLKIMNRPDGAYQVFSTSGTADGQRTNMLLLRKGCAQGSVILIKLGRELASVTTPCQVPP